MFRNSFLEAVLHSTGIDIAKRCEHVTLPSRTMLYASDVRPDFLHFLTSGVASIMTTMNSGTTIEVGMFGSEGFPEATHLLGSMRGHKWGQMQVAGTAFRIECARFQRDFLRCEGVLPQVLKVAQFESLVTAQMAACNGLHGVDARLARWLLMVHDRVGVTELAVTQEYLSETLGIRRPSVTISAGHLQRHGIIDYRRGLIRIHRRDLLEGAACECYGLLRSLRDRLFAER